MTDERAKEIAEWLHTVGTAYDLTSPEVAQFLAKLYDDIQAIKASMGGLSFLHAGIQPVRKVDQ